MEQELFNKLTEEERLRYNNLSLQLENCQLRLFIAQHNFEEFVSQMKDKYSEVTKNGNDK